MSNTPVLGLGSCSDIPVSPEEDRAFAALSCAPRQHESVPLVHLVL